jgi:nucleotide-binding universal stress UspA family protein
MNIVVGYVPGSEGLAAVEHAVAVAERDSAKLTIVNSGTWGDDSRSSFASPADLDALASKLADLGVDHDIRQPPQAQSPAGEILRAAGDVSADLIVIGLRRRSAVGKLFLGSTAQQVILEADCPVVSVKRPPA